MLGKLWDTRGKKLKNYFISCFFFLSPTDGLGATAVGRCSARRPGDDRVLARGAPERPALLESTRWPSPARSHQVPHGERQRSRTIQ